MARPEKLLSARLVQTAGPGQHSDGGGLYLLVDREGRRSWIYRYSLNGRRREMGLGPAAQVTLAEARAARDKWRAEILAGRDPIDERDRLQTEPPEAPKIPTFGEIAESYMKQRETTWRNAKHRAQWKMTLEVYAKDLWSKPVDQINAQAVLAVLLPIWTTKAETASRVRGRIESILDAARALGHVPEDRNNPARWRGHLDKLLPKRQKLTRGHHAAMPFKDVPAFVADLRRADSVSARALEFTILTAARTSETLLAEHQEFDLDEALWVVPKERMKAQREHRVPLSDRAVEIIKQMRATFPDSQFVFPGARPKRPLSNMALEMFLRKRDLEITVHGFRSSFSDWRGDATAFPKELAEAALAHIIGDKTEAAYRRSDALERRREMMVAWALFIERPPSGSVVPFRATSTH